MLATTADDGDPKAKDELLRTSDRVAVAVAYMPPTDLRPWFRTNKHKEWEALRFDPALAGAYSPLALVSPKSAPTLLIHGDKDFGVPLELSEKMLAECRRNHVPCELLVIKGAGHGFAGKDRKQAEVARDAWFEKYLLPPKTVGRHGRWTKRVATMPTRPGPCAGSLAGAYWGEAGIPEEWLEGLARRDMIEKALRGLLEGQG